MLSSWLRSLLGLQLIELLFGEFGQHADSGSYSAAYAVCVDVCWCNDAFLLFHSLNTWNCSRYLIRLLSSVFPNIFTLIPCAVQGWGEDPGRGKCFLSSSFYSAGFSHPLSSLLSVREQACQSSSAPSSHLHNVRFSGLGRLITGTFLLLFTANPQAETRAGVIAGEGF